MYMVYSYWTIAVVWINLSWKSGIKIQLFQTAWYMWNARTGYLISYKNSMPIIVYAHIQVLFCTCLVSVGFSIIRIASPTIENLCDDPNVSVATLEIIGKSIKSVNSCRYSLHKSIWTENEIAEWLLPAVHRALGETTDLLTVGFYSAQPICGINVVDVFYAQGESMFAIHPYWSCGVIYDKDLVRISRTNLRMKIFS